MDMKWCECSKVLIDGARGPVLGIQANIPLCYEGMHVYISTPPPLHLLAQSRGHHSSSWCLHLHTLTLQITRGETTNLSLHATISQWLPQIWNRPNHISLKSQSKARLFPIMKHFTFNSTNKGTTIRGNKWNQVIFHSTRLFNLYNLINNFNFFK